MYIYSVLASGLLSHHITSWILQPLQPFLKKQGGAFVLEKKWGRPRLIIGDCGGQQFPGYETVSTDDHQSDSRFPRHVASVKR